MAITKAFALSVPVPGGSASGSGTVQTTGTFDSTGYTHLVIYVKHEGATTSITPSDNKSSPAWTPLTKINNRAVDSWGQFHYVKIGTPGTLHTVTVTLGAARDFRTILVWRVNSGTGVISVVSDVGAASPSDTTAIDAGTIANAAADSIVSFMGVSEYNASTYTVGAGWTEDVDINGPNYTYGQSRGAETTTSIDPVCTGSAAQDWATRAAAFKEAAAGGAAELPSYGMPAAQPARWGSSAGWNKP